MGRFADNRLRIARRRVFVGLFALSLCTGCIREDYEGPDPSLPTRTVLVWMAAENSLAEEAVQKIEAMRQGWTWSGNKCLIYVDTPNEGAQLLRLRGGCAVTPTPYVETVHEYGTENSASAETFSRVLQEVTAEYPADSYGLLVFSHASGWMPSTTLQNPLLRSIGWDGGIRSGTADHAEMELADFAAAIPDGQFDFILFEACLMAGVEVAYELRDKTDYLLASSAEILSPGFTPVYPAAWRVLFDTSKSVGTALEEFGRAYMDYVEKLGGDARSATLSLIETAQLDALAAQVRSAGLSFEKQDVSGLQHFDRPGSYGETPAGPRYFDLGQWLGRAIPAETYSVCEEQLKRIVNWKASTERFLPSQNGFDILHHSGLTVYLPQSQFEALNEAYRQTAWYRAVYGGL